MPAAAILTYEYLYLQMYALITVEHTNTYAYPPCTWTHFFLLFFFNFFFFLLLRLFKVLQKGTDALIVFQADVLLPILY